MQNTVQQDIRTYSEAVTSAPTKSSFCEDSLKTIVHDVIEKEDRSKHLIIHGLREETGEHLSERVSCLLEELGEKPKVEVCRIGRVSSKELARPVKVIFSNSTSPRIVLLRSKHLKRSDRYKNVYISPDRTPEERTLHRQLVLTMKNKRADEPGYHHFIKNGKVCSVARTDNE